MIDLTTKYRTRDGREVRLLMTDGGGTFPVIGAVCNGDGSWSLASWTADGFCFDDKSECDNDLVPVPEAFDLGERWINVYRLGTSLHVSRIAADEAASTDRIACLKIHIRGTVGEGL